MALHESMDIQIPEVVPVMTLRETVLFPHAVMPLFIFEPRYRQMLKDVLQSHRLFAVFNERETDDEEGHEEQPTTMGTVGMVRAAHQNPDGTSNLALQGISRVRLVDIVQESPYPLIRVEPCSDVDEHSGNVSLVRGEILSMIEEHPHLTRGLPKEYVDFIHSVQGNGPFIDVAAHSICQDSGLKQQLLETLSLQQRFNLLRQFLNRECCRFELFRKLQGDTRDDEIDLN